MFEIDKKQFGDFIAELRKQKRITQKELAEKLFVSDKAVSKWECGLSMPDITLLKPLSEVLGVTVTELLECRRIDETEHIDIEKMDSIINKAVHISEEEVLEQRARKKKSGLVFAICTLVGCLESMIILIMGIRWDVLIAPILLSLILGFVFGIWFCFFAKEKLPSFYDENKMSYYSDGFFSINMVGIRFNNSNWKHILQVGRIWSMTSMVVGPLICLICNMISVYEITWKIALALVLILLLGGLFVPLYVVAKKYE